MTHSGTVSRDVMQGGRGGGRGMNHNGKGSNMEGGGGYGANPGVCLARLLGIPEAINEFFPRNPFLHTVHHLR